MIKAKHSNIPGRIATFFILCIIPTVLFGLVFLLSLWTDRNIEFWASYYKGAEVECPFWLSVIVTIVTNGVCILCNVIAEVARLFI